MGEQKDLGIEARSWSSAMKILKEKGIANISTSGGDDWNETVRERLSNDLKMDVVFFGPAPGYNNDSGYFRFGIRVDNNRQAVNLLSKTNED